jgi:hypothetical protein
MTTSPVGAEPFHADKRTDEQTETYDETNSHFSQFSERAYILHIYEVHMDISGYINKAYGSYNPDYYKKRTDMNN